MKISSDWKEVTWGTKGERNKSARGKKRMAVLQTAARMFNERSFENTSLTDIAETIGITKPALYYYVKNKEDILYSIGKMVLEDCMTVLDEADKEPKTGRDRLVSFLTQYINIMQTDFGRCLITTNEMAMSEDSRHRLLALRRQIDSAIREIIAEGVVDGSLQSPSPQFSTYAIFGAVNWMCTWHRKIDDFGSENIADLFMDFFLNGLAPRSP
jgi:AcrR family transcriptional regulator